MKMAKAVFVVGIGRTSWEVQMVAEASVATNLAVFSSVAEAGLGELEMLARPRKEDQQCGGRLEGSRSKLSFSIKQQALLPELNLIAIAKAVMCRLVFVDGLQSGKI
jgi:hypothetical protein